MRLLSALIAIQASFLAPSEAQNVALPKALLEAKISASGIVTLKIKGVEPATYNKILYIRKDLGTGAEEVIDAVVSTSPIAPSALVKGALYRDLTAKPSRSYQYRIRGIVSSPPSFSNSDPVSVVTPPELKFSATPIGMSEVGGSKVQLSLDYENAPNAEPFEIARVTILRTTGDFGRLQKILDETKSIPNLREQFIQRGMNLRQFATYQLPCENIQVTKTCVDQEVADNLLLAENSSYDYLAIVYFKGIEFPILAVSNKVETPNVLLPAQILKPSIVISKSKHLLYLLDGDRVIKRYPITIGTKPGRKLYEDQASTPEGQYRILGIQDLGQAKYHRAFDLNYPNDEDKRRYSEARTRDSKAGTHTEIPLGENGKVLGIGGEIQIHGASSADVDGVLEADWTKGCISLRNSDMDELAGVSKIRAGTSVLINP